MKKAVVFDWDGTIISCEGKIEYTIKTVVQSFPLAANFFNEKIARNAISRGWIKNGYIASVDEDYFSHMFGLLAETIADVYQFSNDEAWSSILSHFKDNYGKIPASAMLEFELLYELASVADIYIVSNSAVDNLVAESQRLGLCHSAVKFVGGAKKYKVESNLDQIIGIPTDRPHYRSILTGIATNYNDIIVVGDNFSCDLSVPLSVNWRVGYVPNVYSPQQIVDFLDSRDAIIGTITDFVDRVLTEV